MDKVFGPGNAYVTQAKVRVSMDPRGAAIDMPAGPSEVLVIADAEADPAFVAADLLSQAEHGVDSLAVLASDSEALIRRVRDEVERQLEALSRREIAEQALRSAAPRADVRPRRGPGLRERLRAGSTSSCRSPSRGVWPRASATRAPCSSAPGRPRRSATTRAARTTCCRPHGYARAWSGLGLEAYQKTITFQELTPDGLRDLGPTVETLAALEGLDGHGRAVRVRLDRLAEEGR